MKACWKSPKCCRVKGFQLVGNLLVSLYKQTNNIPTFETILTIVETTLACWQKTILNIIFVAVVYLCSWRNQRNWAYRERNFGKFFANRLFEDGPEVDSKRRSRWNHMSAVCLSYDAEAPLLRLLLLLPLLLLLCLRRHRWRNLWFIMSIASASLLLLRNRNPNNIELAANECIPLLQSRRSSREKTCICQET